MTLHHFKEIWNVKFEVYAVFLSTGYRKIVSIFHTTTSILTSSEALIFFSGRLLERTVAVLVIKFNSRLEANFTARSSQRRHQITFLSNAKSSQVFLQPRIRPSSLAQTNLVSGRLQKVWSSAEPREIKEKVTRQKCKTTLKPARRMLFELEF